MGRATVSQQVTAGGSAIQKVTDTNPSLEVSALISIPAAKVGELTTRTDNDTGVITMVAGHGLTTGMLVDVYWLTGGGGKRLGMAATVTVNALAVEGGTGDSLPTLNDDVTVMNPVVHSAWVPAATVEGIAASSPQIGVVRLLEADDTEIVAMEVAANDPYVWVDGSGVTNPVTADAEQVTFSHGQASAVEMQFKAAYN
jgi:hypothetical protein